MKRTAVISLVALALIVALFFSWYSYQEWNFKTSRPEVIQRELLGKIIAYNSDLIDYQNETAFGDGQIRWTYKMPVSFIKKYKAQCTHTLANDLCTLTSGRPKYLEDVKWSINIYGDNLLIMEEWN